MKTWVPTGENEVERKWWLVDASGKNLGRMCTQLAKVLIGKHKPQYTPHSDTGDFIVVINAEKVTMTGNKWLEKTYYRHSRFFGSMKSTSAQEMLAAKPTKIVREAVRGMLPKNKLARQLINKLKVHAGPDHPHAAQKPQALKLTE